MNILGWIWSEDSSVDEGKGRDVSEKWRVYGEWN